MKNKIKYRGIPAYIDFVKQEITGRNWFLNQIVRLLVRLDQIKAYNMSLKGEKFDIPITFSDADYDGE